MKSWRPEVQVIGEGDKWCANGLRFATKLEAEYSARDLMSRWTLVTACRAAESDDEPNYSIVDGKLIAVTQATA